MLNTIMHKFDFDVNLYGEEKNVHARCLRCYHGIKLLLYTTAKN